jgi:hypothetical protein
MMLQKGRVRTLCEIRWKAQRTALIDQAPELWREELLSDKNLHIFVDGDKAMIKQPVKSSRKG